MLKAPFRAFFSISVHETIYVYSWLYILFVYLILYFVVPLSIVNSSNGFKSGSVVLISSLIIFAISVMAYVIWFRESACKSKRGKALYYLEGRKAYPPKYLEAGIDVVNDKPEIDWTPLKPFIK